MEDVIVKLQYPILLKDDKGQVSEITSLRFGRFKAKHLKLLPEGFIENQGSMSPHEIIPLIAGLGNISIESANEIDLKDLMEIANIIEDFLSKSLETGEKLSGE